MHTHALSEPSLADRHALVAHLLQRHGSRESTSSAGASPNPTARLEAPSSVAGLTGRTLATAGEAAEAAAVLRASISAGETLHLRHTSVPAIHAHAAARSAQANANASLHPQPSSYGTQISRHSAAVVARARAIRGSAPGGPGAASASGQVGAAPTAAASSSSAAAASSPAHEWTAAMLGLTSVSMAPPTPSSMISPPPGAPYTRDEFAQAVRDLKERKQARSRRKDPQSTLSAPPALAPTGSRATDEGKIGHHTSHARHILTHIPPQPHLLAHTPGSRIPQLQQQQQSNPHDFLSPPHAPMLLPEALVVAAAPMMISGATSTFALQQQQQQRRSAGQLQPKRAKIDTATATQERVTSPTPTTPSYARPSVRSPTPTTSAHPPAAAAPPSPSVASVRASSSEGARLHSPVSGPLPPGSSDPRPRLASPPASGVVSTDGQRAAAARTAEHKARAKRDAAKADDLVAQGRREKEAAMQREREAMYRRRSEVYALNHCKRVYHEQMFDEFMLELKEKRSGETSQRTTTKRSAGFHADIASV